MKQPQRTAVALGSFDGLHKGHLSVIACALAFRERGLIPVVLLFDRHPLQVLTGQAPPALLQTELRDEMLRALGAQTRVISFAAVKDLSCDAFVSEILCGQLQAGAVCCGENFRFGAGNAGDTQTLRALCASNGAALSVASAVLQDGQPISSTRIRDAVLAGDLPAANAMLGRAFNYKLEVVHGSKRGRLMGAPTINQQFPADFVIPRRGVYASAAIVEGTEYPAVTNIGLRPSFAGSDLRSETNLLGFDGDLYGQEIEVRLFAYLREETKFDSMAALSAQIRADAAQSLELFQKRGTDHV
ncbi:MAG: riboflavin biosynthesis protein RibF [Clostridia bacterium]|nr:riboflavin biosynthesis protein RibF [Oscillospiraceae bacterium]MBQ6268470.1 riboflavin biosynthesis protein RibF [Clostridia bacterium]